MGEQPHQVRPGCLLLIGIVLAFLGINPVIGGIASLNIGVLIFGLLLLGGGIALVLKVWRDKGAQIMNDNNPRETEKPAGEDGE